MDVVDRGRGTAPLHVRYGLTIREDVLGNDRFAARRADVVEREWIGRRPAIRSFGDPLIIDILKICGGHHYTNTWTLGMSKSILHPVELA